MLIRELPPTCGLPLLWSDFTTVRSGTEGSLEHRLESFTGASFVRILSSGTACLVVAFRALRQLRPVRDEVVIPGYTCPLVAIAAAQAGLRVVPCDLSRNSLEMDADILASLIGERTLCVVPTHLGGLPCDLDQVRILARSAGAFVVEDAAQALGATWRQRSVGMNGDIGVFSLTVGKGLTIYEGGFLTAEDENIQRALSEACESLVQTDLIAELKTVASLFSYRLGYNPVGLSFAYGAPLRRALRKNEIAVALGDVFPRSVAVREVGAYRKTVGASAVRRLHDAVRSSARRGRQRSSSLAGVAGVHVFGEREDASGSWPFLTVLFDSAESCDRALSRLWTSGLGVTKLFASALTGYDYMMDIVPRVELPQSISFASRCLTISNSEQVSERDFAAISRVIGEQADLSLVR